MKCELYHDEEWRDIPGYEGLYQASSLGRIRSVDNIQEIIWKNRIVLKPKRGRIIKQGNHRCGYSIVWLSKNGNVKAYTVHRLVASTFIDNPNRLQEINHKDGNKRNNAITNLEWVSRSENLKHAYSVLGRKNGNERRVRCVETGEVFESIKKASDSIDRSHGAVEHVLYGLNENAGWYHWEWA